MAWHWALVSVAMVVAVLLPLATADSSTVPEILKKNGLPAGLLPRSVKSYTLNENGKFKVVLESACYAKIQNDVYYASTITGDLSFGQIQNLGGIQAKEGWFWLSVTGIVAKPDTISFQVGPFAKDLDISLFSSPPTCIKNSNSKSFSDLLSQALNGDLEVNVSNILGKALPRRMLV